MIRIHKTTPYKHKYFAPLTAISPVPENMFFLGTIPVERVPTVAIVGTRKPTPYGREVAYTLAYELAKKGVVIVSGLALGTDSIAHRGALEAAGTTIAVLANSLEQIYPRSHKTLAEQIIAANGAIVSEYEPPTNPREFQFLARNRIISGLSDAIVIVEAAARSGTLNTAAHALEQGREVFAVPGNITSPLSKGCNMLLKQGAAPATCSQDILETIAPQLLGGQTALPIGTTPLETKIIALIQQGIRDGDMLQQQSGADVREFSQTLTLMEINGTLRALGSNQWSIG